MNSQRLTFLYISLFFIFTQGLWERIFELEPGATIMVELPLWIYLALSYKTISIKNPFKKYIAIYIVISLLISILNGSDIYTWIKYIRFFIYFYLFFVSLWSTSIRLKQWGSIFRFLIFLIILQGIGSSFNLFILNNRIEGHVGLMSTLGGTKAATFPLFICSFSFVIFLFGNRRNKKLNIYLILMVISSFLVGYTSSKRTIFFSIPLFLFLITILSYAKLKLKKYFYTKLFFFSLIILAFIPIFIYGITTSKGLNYSLTGNETNIEVLSSAIDYADEYDNKVSTDGATAGRSGTTSRILLSSTSSIKDFFVGKGLKSYKNEDIRRSLGIGYGIVGFTRDLMAGGWLLMLLTVIIFIKIITVNMSEVYDFTKVLRSVMLLVFLFTHFLYSSDYIVH